MKFYTLWDKGRDEAPPLVKTVISSWEAEVGAHNIEVFDSTDLDRELAQLGIDTSWIPIAQKSDLLRTKLLSDRSGVWFDATLLPMQGAAKWIEDQTSKAGFFALSRPGSDRIISSFLLASSHGNPVCERMLKCLTAYFSVQRKPGWKRTLRPSYIRWRKRAKRDPRWSVSPQDGAKYPYFPYFTFHYLFEELIHSDEEVNEVWEAMPRFAAGRALLVQRCLDYGSVEEFLKLYPDVIMLSPVHKLSWKKPLPSQFLEEFPFMSTKGRPRGGGT